MAQSMRECFSFFSSLYGTQTKLKLGGGGSLVGAGIGIMLLGTDAALISGAVLLFLGLLMVADVLFESRRPVAEHPPEEASQPQYQRA